ncbi:MAG TPA: mannosyl-3-phosphoglycerate synthase, partial [Nitrososphaera sp.]|nr:mannosyl-3-phosphoglycerate synthase [Nitrososphaera sp.]
VKIFAAGFGMSNTPYCNVRISWVFKPKVRNNSLQFSKWGRVSEITNRSLNSLLASITGFETEVIKTGNAGEHALSMPLAECLHYSSGYSIEAYEFIDIFEKFGGILPSGYPQVMDKGVELFQIETRNPHFHEDKGVAHLEEMLEASLSAIQNSAICPADLRDSIHVQLDHKSSRKKHMPKYRLLDPINTIDISDFEKGIRDGAETLVKLGGLR